MEKATHNLSLGEGTRSSAKKPATTRTDSSNSLLLESKLERTGRWTRSGKKNPCPICGRTKDDKCAFKNDTIHCYCGVSNSPPDLKLGGIIQINYGSTRDWALVKKNAGFSGNHCIFIPNKPLDKSKPLIKRHIPKVSIPRLNKVFNVVSENVSEAIKPDLMILNLQQLEKVSIKTDEALAETKSLLALSKQFSQKELINDIQLANLFETTKAYLYKLTNRAEQIKQFRAVCLGEEEVLRDNI
mgnify:CR=1 FL=1